MLSAAKSHRPYRSPVRQAQARATRQRVVQAANALFAERGYAATTIGAVATRAKVSVPTVESLFRTKSGLLKAAIDVAVAGDDEPEPRLGREWARQVEKATDAETVLSVVAAVLAPAQARSAGLVLSVFEGATSGPELASLAARMTTQRAVMAAWLVERLSVLGALRDELDQDEATGTVFGLMEPALFDRLTRGLGWTLTHYEKWLARSLLHLLVADPPSPELHRPEQGKGHVRGPLKRGLAGGGGK
jgi:AcrR family transcriptional regulator